VKEKILNKTIELFLTLGAKSVTMDDIAKELGISKKTIYSYFPNKENLVEAVTFRVFEQINDGINKICKANYNPIEELFIVKDLILKQLKNERSSPQFQLEKYYPKIFNNLKKKKFGSVERCIDKNLKKGISEGFYRKEIDIRLITRLYFIGILGIKNEELFKREEFSVLYLMDSFLEYHLRALVTEKGLKTLENIIKK
jgi:AcrR family transcriptional regulator